MYLGLLPGAYFFGMVYSESLFLLALAGAVLAIRTRRWRWAALAGAAMTATRVNGIVLVPALAWIAWRSTRDAGDRRRAAVALAVTCCGAGAFVLYNYALSGDGLAWYAASSAGAITRAGTR
ncbi:MAG: hypothetical protein R2712_20890 [Vicinamibacterales bacterium]